MKTEWRLQVERQRQRKWEEEKRSVDSCAGYSLYSLTSSSLFPRIKYFSIVIRESQRFCNIWFKRNWTTITDITLHTSHSCLFLRYLRRQVKNKKKRCCTYIPTFFTIPSTVKQISLLPKRKKSRTAKARFHKGESNCTLSWVCWTKFSKNDSIGITTVCIGQSVSDENKLPCSKIASKAS